MQIESSFCQVGIKLHVLKDGESVYIICNSSIRRISLFFVFIHISMDSCIFIWCWKLFQVDSCVPLTCPHCIVFWALTMRCSWLILYLSCPSPRISRFSKKPWSLFTCRMLFTNHDLGMLIDTGVSLLQGPLRTQLSKYILIHAYTCYNCFCVYPSMCVCVWEFILISVALIILIIFYWTLNIIHEQLVSG